METRSVKVSVIIAAYNHAKFLPAAIESMINQTFKESYEILIVDDASTDETPLILKDFPARDSKIKIFCMKTNVGPGAARNYAIQQAKGEYIAILDGDDIAKVERLEKQACFLDEHPLTDMVFSLVTWIDDELKPIENFPARVSSGKFPQNCDEIFKVLYLESNKIPNTSLMFRKSAFDKIGGYPPDVYISEDWILCMKMAASQMGISAIPEALVLQRRGQTHSHLMSNKIASFKAGRAALHKIKEWLKASGIHRFDNLYRQALANEWIREARYRQGVYGFFLCIWALILCSKNPYAWKNLAWFFEKLATRLTNGNITARNLFF